MLTFIFSKNGSLPPWEREGGGGVRLDFCDKIIRGERTFPLPGGACLVRSTILCINLVVADLNVKEMFLSLLGMTSGSFLLLLTHGIVVLLFIRQTSPCFRILRGTTPSNLAFQQYPPPEISTLRYQRQAQFQAKFHAERRQYHKPNIQCQICTGFDTESRFIDHLST